MGKILPVTMGDIARCAGVSQTAVSLAFRHDASIPVPTRRRIQETARKLGYRPHAAISTLMAQIRARRPVKFQSVLAAITTWGSRQEREQHLTWKLQWEGAQRRAAELGYSLEEFWVADPAMTTRRLSTILRTRNIDGVIVFPVNRPAPLNLPWDQVAAITVGYTLEAPLLHRVATSHYDAVLIALERLRTRGYRRIGLVLDGQMNDRGHRQWLAAFSAFGVEPGRAASTAIADLPAADPRTRLQRWVAAYQPDAILVGGSYPIRRWLEEFGLLAPEHVGLVRLAHLLPDEGCSCIDESWSLVGAAAVDLLVGQLHRGERGIPASPLVTLLRGTWREGGSVRPEEAGNPRPPPSPGGAPPS